MNHCITFDVEYSRKPLEIEVWFQRYLSIAIYCVRNVVEKFVKNGSTVSVCTLDLSKAFDRMNHYALFVKLMEHKFPSELLAILEMWFNKSVSCVKWNNNFNFICLSAGVRQGGVLSPYLFAVFMEDIVDKIKAVNLGCHVSLICTSIFLHCEAKKLHPCSFCNSLIKLRSSMPIFCKQPPNSHDLNTVDYGICGVLQ